MFLTDTNDLSSIFGSIGLVFLFYAVLILLGIWDFVWKAIAMWKAAQRDDKLWFILCLILNTIGILPIIYVFAIAPKQKNYVEQCKPNIPPIEQ